MIAQVLQADPQLAKRIKARPGLRLPGCWDGFELAVRAILGQQVTVKGASTLAGRIVQRFGKPISGAHRLTHLFPTAEILAAAKFEGLGLTQKRQETIRALSRAVRDGKITFDDAVDSETFAAQMREIPGIGDWTAQYVAMRALGEPDALPASDLGLLHAIGTSSGRELQKRAEAWRPWRSYATMYLWSAHAR
jgi:AraC family transcriptional regulator of adaptative response / DNA-3-methyladenine glycosylase II